MDYKEENQSRTQTITLEKQTTTQSPKTDTETSVHTFPSINLFSSDSLTKKDFEKETTEQTKSDNKDEKLEKLKQQIMENQREKQKQEQLEKEQLEKEQEQEAKKEEQKEDIEEKQDEVVESLYNTSLIESEVDNKEFAEELENLTNTKKSSYKFRFRLLTGVFCCIMAILTGWIIGNFVEIASTSSQIATETASQQQYNVNIADYLSKISRLDSDVENADSPADDSLFPIDEIITITPQPLEDPTEYEQESNWFDSICNWIRNLFGG